MNNRGFTNHDTESFYDTENDLYKDVRDPNGSVHFGVFEDGEQPADFVKAANRLNNWMISKGNITNTSTVLDIGCGTGAVADYIQQKIGCTFTGIDLSGVRIEEAKKRALHNDRLTFLKMSADELSFPRGLFSHVMSQSTLYHVHKREKAITKIYDVLKKDGIFVFEDFVRPNAFVSKDSMKYVYERLMYRTGFNHQNYQEFLQSLGFKIIEALDISTHMEKSYAFLTQICEEKLVSGKPEFMSEYKKLYEAYPYMVKAIQKGDLGWSFFVCKK